MGWAIGYDSHWQRDIGYGVPAECDHPDCHEQIDRGLSYVCGGEPYGDTQGCGLYFCGAHQVGFDQRCERCEAGKDPFPPKADVDEWVRHKLTDESWAAWRAENHEAVKALVLRLSPSAREAQDSPSVSTGTEGKSETTTSTRVRP